MFPYIKIDNCLLIYMQFSFSCYQEIANLKKLFKETLFFLTIKNWSAVSTFNAWCFRNVCTDETTLPAVDGEVDSGLVS